MIFTSYEFLLLLASAFTGFQLLPRSWRVSWLLLHSYIFYAYAHPWLTPFLLGTTLAAYACGWLVQRPGMAGARKTIAFIAGLVVVLSGLIFFKYTNFVAENLHALFGDGEFEAFDIILPVGISFFTFQNLAYIIDTWRGRETYEPSLQRYALFIAFFPQLVAGPIERGYNILPQLVRLERQTADRLWSGAERISWGLVKKMVFADRFGAYADTVFATASTASGPELIIGALAFGLQIYFDFSAYSDIAIGTARLFGVRLMENFNFPYRSRSIADFWRRWHISLSSWFRDYVYIPLGGDRAGFGRLVVNLAIVWAITGLWHGAAWTYVLWGALHGVYLIAYRAKNKFIAPPGQGWPGAIPAVLRGLLTFTAVHIAWIFFRADTLEAGTDYLTGIVTRFVQAPVDPLNFLIFTPLVAIALALHIVNSHRKPSEDVPDRPGWRHATQVGFNLLLVLFLAVSHQETFIYFVF